MKDQSIVCFLSAARNGKISFAAAELSMSQQAVSRNIRSLEEELGFLLFFRRNDGIELTEAGKRFFELFKNFDDDYQGILGTLFHPTGEVLRVGWSSWCACDSAIDRVSSVCGMLFSKQGAEIEICSDRKLFDALFADELDVVFTSRYAAGNDFEALRTMPVAELPIYSIRAPESWETGGAVTFLTTRCRDETDEDVAARVKNEVSRLNFTPDSMEILPNRPSVFVQLFMGNYISLSPYTHRLQKCAEQLELRPVYSFQLFAMAKNRPSVPIDTLFEQFRKEDMCCDGL